MVKFVSFYITEKYAYCIEVWTYNFLPKYLFNIQQTGYKNMQTYQS